MCGFAGFCDSGDTDAAEKEETVLKMTEAIRHRGPDDTGVFCDESVALGFARLKIIDIEGGVQPMVSACGRYVLCFNGEIYNYKELRTEQESRFGERFRTQSDTEVLLSVLVHSGRGGLARLRGMFALCLYDRVEKTVLLARDPFGIKPLYYGIFDGCFMFASEIKAFLSHPKFVKMLNADILPYYLQFQYVPTEETSFKGVFRLQAGHTLYYDGRAAKAERYFFPPSFKKHGYIPHSFFVPNNTLVPYQRNAGKTKDELDRALSDSVNKHMRSDTEVGAFLSGGVDSGLIADYSKPKTAFSIGFGSYGFDERDFAKQRADIEGTSLQSIFLGADEFFNTVESVQYHSDEPYANLSAVPLYVLARKASDKVRVVLSGEGADELFGGYDLYLESPAARLYRTLPTLFRRSASRTALKGKLGDFLRRNGGDERESFIGQARIMSAVQAQDLLAPQYAKRCEPTDVTKAILSRTEGASRLREKMYLDLNLWMPFDILGKADKMTMASSLELRVPYLDKEVLSVAEKCSDRLLVRGRTSKYLLRRLAADKLGAESAYRPKKGFPVPFRTWIKQKKYADRLENAFKSKECSEFFNAGKLMDMLKAHIEGRENNARALYTVYAFLVWYGVFFKDKDKSSQKSFILELEDETTAKAGEENIKNGVKL